MSYITKHKVFLSDVSLRNRVIHFAGAQPSSGPSVPYDPDTDPELQNYETQAEQIHQVARQSLQAVQENVEKEQQLRRSNPYVEAIYGVVDDRTQIPGLEERYFDQPETILEILGYMRQQKSIDSDKDARILGKMLDPQTQIFYYNLFKTFPNELPDLNDPNFKRNFYDKFPANQRPDISKGYPKAMIVMYEKLNEFKRKLKDSYHRIKTNEDMLEMATDTASTAKNVFERYFVSLQRAGRQIPEKYWAMATGIGLILAFTKQYREVGLGILGASVLGQVTTSAETPSADTKCTKEYKQVYKKRVLRQGIAGDRAISMLQNMSVTITGGKSFNQIWEAYTTAKNKQSIDEIYQKFSKEGQVQQNDIPRIEHRLINIKSQQVAFEAMFAFENRFKDLIDDLKKPYPLANGNTIIPWEYMIQMPFGDVVNELTRMSREKQLGENGQTVTSYVINFITSTSADISRKIMTEVNEFEEEFGGNGGKLSSTAKNILNVPDADFSSERQTLRMYGLEFKLTKWLNADGKEIYGTDTKNAAGGKLYYYDAAGVRQELTLWFEESGKTQENETKHIQEIVKNNIIREKNALTKKPTGVNLADPIWDVKKEQWQIDIDLPDYLSTQKTQKKLNLSFDIAFNDVRENQSPYTIRFNDPQEKNSKYNELLPYLERVYLQQLTENMSKNFGVNTENIKIKPDQLFGVDGQFKNINSLSIEITFDDKKEPMLATANFDINTKTWSLEMMQADNYEKYLHLMLKNLKSELYSVPEKLLGIPIPGFLRSYWTTHFEGVYSPDSATWEGFITALESYLLSNLNSKTTDSAKKDYLNEMSKKIGETISKMKDYQTGGTREGEALPPDIFQGWQENLQNLNFNPDYELDGKKLLKNLDDLNFNQEIKFKIYLKYRNDIEQELKGHENEPQAQEYAKYVALKYNDVYQFIYSFFKRDYEDFDAHKEYLDLGKHIPTYEDFKNQNKCVRRTEKDPATKEEIEYAYNAQIENALINIEQELFQEKDVQSLLQVPRLLVKASALRIRSEYLNKIKKGETIDPQAYKDYLEKRLYFGNFSSIGNQTSIEKILRYTYSGAEDIISYIKEQGLGGLLGKLANMLGGAIGDLIGAILHGTMYGIKNAFVRTFEGEEEFKTSHPEILHGIRPISTDAQSASGEIPPASSGPDFRPLRVDQLQEDNIPFVFEKPVDENGNVISDIHLQTFYPGEILIYQGQRVINLGSVKHEEYVVQNVEDKSIFIVRKRELTKALGKQPLNTSANAMPGDMMTIIENGELIDVEITKVGEGAKPYIKYQYLNHAIGETPKTAIIYLGEQASGIIDQEVTIPSDITKIMTFYAHGTSIELSRTKKQIPQRSTNNKCIVYDYSYDLNLSPDETTYALDQSKEREYDYLHVVSSAQPNNGNIGEIRINKSSPKSIEVREKNISNQWNDWHVIEINQMQIWLDKVST